MEYPVQLLKERIKDVTLNTEQLNQFQKYGEILSEWNEKMNLTAIREPKEVVIKHFYDSLTIFSYIDIAQGASIIDVGTGAGFPGVAIKIARPDIKLTLLDSLNKRITFLRELTNQLNLKSDCMHSRAEDAGQNSAFREKYDFAVARAVANLRELSEYCLPFVKIGGLFVSMKGPDLNEELNGAKHAIQILGGEIIAVHELLLPEKSKRTIVVIRKVKNTPRTYPRPSAKIAKKPLI